jgi:hypothetical protein
MRAHTIRITMMMQLILMQGRAQQVRVDLQTRMATIKRILLILMVPVRNQIKLDHRSARSSLAAPNPTLNSKHSHLLWMLAAQPVQDDRFC